MRLDRFQQMVAAASLRRWGERRERAALVSWQTRIEASYTAAGYMLAKNSENKALANAQELGFDDIERAMAGAASPAEALPSENRPGSYEALMGWAQQQRLIPEGTAGIEQTWTVEQEQ